MASVRITTGRRFEAAAGESLLDAALRADLTLAYSCRTGRCGTCKGMVRSGTTAALQDEIGLSADERVRGWILTCVRGALSDVELDVEDLGSLRLHLPRTLPCRIQAVVPLADDVLQLQLRLPPTSAFDFHPGQYVDVISHGGLRRSYSIANAPGSRGTLLLHVKRVLNGAMSRYWFETAKVNDLLRIHGPLGTFVLRDREDLDLVFLATGTGLAPVKAMLEGMPQIGQTDGSETRGSVSVFWGGRVPQDLYWDARVTGSDHRFIPVLSRADASWKGARGYVQEVALAEGRDWSRTTVYACGSEAMIRSARTQLIDAGLSERRFWSDAFVSSGAT